MRSIVPELSRTAAQELVDEQRKEYRFIGSQRRIPGLILFQYDLTTGELQQAPMKKEIELTVDGRLNKNNKVEAGALCLYVQALNKENALRKVRSLLRRKNVREELFKRQKNGE